MLAVCKKYIMLCYEQLHKESNFFMRSVSNTRLLKITSALDLESLQRVEKRTKSHFALCHTHINTK